MPKLNIKRLTVLWGALVVLTLHALLYGMGAGTSRSAEAALSGGQVQYLPNKIVVKFKEGHTFGARLSKAGSNSFDNLLSAYNVTHLEQVSKNKSRLQKRSSSVGIERIYFAHFSGDNSPVAVAEAFKKHPLVEYAEPLRVYRLTATPNDPLFAQQFNFQIIQAQAAWDVVKGEQGNVVVAVVDGGTDVDHSDLAANIWRNPGESGNGRETNGIDDDNNGFVDDFQGWNFANNSNDPSGLTETPTSANHGAHVAGIIGAVTDNSNQVSGVSWNAKIMAINAAFKEQDLAIAFGYEGVIYAADNGADVINLSWGGPGAPSIFEQDIIDHATQLGAVVVAAAGNDNSSAPHFPSSYKNVISVASTGNGDFKSDFSNFGTTIDISAPGETIRSTFHNGVTGLFSGTSQAAPHVAGVIALVKTQHPDWLGVQAGEQVRVAVDNIDGVNPDLVGLLGSGRVNAFRAVTVSNLPSIRIADVKFIDANGNNVIERSESVELQLNLTNYLAPASDVNLTLTKNDPFVTVTSANAFLPSLGTLETTTTPLSFSFDVISNAPSGRQVNFTLQMSNGDYQDRELFTVVIQPLFDNLNINNIAMTLTSIGRIGFATTEVSPPTDGIGFSFKRSPNLLFDGAIIAGAGPTTISNAARGLKSGPNTSHIQDRDFAATSNGSLRIHTPGVRSDQESFAIFEDTFSNTPMKLRITQQSFAMTAAPNDNFILLRYTIQNRGQSALSNFHFGLFFDWDIGLTGNEVFSNLASYDAARKLGIVSSGATFVGVSSLGAANVHYRAINNDTINDDNGFTDAEKWQAISGGVTVVAAGPADVSHVLANGPFSIAANDSITLDFALLAANSLTELRSIADAAVVFWNQLVTTVEEPPAPALPQRFALHQNYPNPFNPTTEIRYDLAQSTDVELRIYNLLGQEIRTLLNRRQAAGSHSIQWDGKNDSGEIVASGIYLYQLRAGDFVQARKMTFIK